MIPEASGLVLHLFILSVINAAAIKPYVTIQVSSLPHGEIYALTVFAIL